MLNRLFFIPLTYKILSMEVREDIPILPMPMISPLSIHPNTEALPSIGFRSRNINLLCLIFGYFLVFYRSFMEARTTQ